MNKIIRDLEHSDMEQVNNICSTISSDDDYISEFLPKWVDSSDYISRGLFDDTELLSICTLHLASSTDSGYIRGLRTKDTRRREGYGKALTEDLMMIAQEKGVKCLFYETINMNVASMGLAKHLGFSLIEQYGLFHLFTPFPPHPTPSPTCIPLNASPERVDEVISSFPSLVPNDHIPYDFQFYKKSPDNLRLLSERTTFQLVLDENDQPGGLYYHSPLMEYRGERATTYVVYTTNRAIYVDMMARIVDESESIEATQVGFIMGPNATKWAKDLGYTDSELGPWPGEYSKRLLVLYEYQFKDDRS
ncbi:MAG: GNAT family N-acetyltransferase [Candidatus Thorarchaeota archaeon]